MGPVEVLRDGDGVPPPPPQKDIGPVEILWDGDGVPPAGGQSENITSHRTSYANGNKALLLQNYSNILSSISYRVRSVPTSADRVNMEADVV